MLPAYSRISAFTFSRGFTLPDGSPFSNTPLSLAFKTSGETRANSYRNGTNNDQAGRPTGGGVSLGLSDHWSPLLRFRVLCAKIRTIFTGMAAVLLPAILVLTVTKTFLVVDAAFWGFVAVAAQTIHPRASQAKERSAVSRRRGSVSPLRQRPKVPASAGASKVR